MKTSLDYLANVAEPKQTSHHSAGIDCLMVREKMGLSEETIKPNRMS